MILAAERPVIYAGGGILKARAADALRALAELPDIHVVTTLMYRGGFPDDHPLALGMPGMHGTYTAVTAMQEADLLIAIGARFDDRVTGKLDGFAPHAAVIHVDIDAAELNKVRHANVAIQADVRLATEALIEGLTLAGAPDAQADRSAWKSTVSGWLENFPLTYDAHVAGDALKPQHVLETLRDNAPDDTIVCSGVGQHQMWASQFWRFNHPYTWINSGGLGTMGFSIPAAIGAKVGKPDRMVWAIDGDGCFQMTTQELVTATVENIPIKVAILNNSYLGMVRQWQEMFYDERYSEVFLSKNVPDYKMWAESMGCFALRVDDPDEVEAAIAAGQRDQRPSGGDRLPHRREPRRCTRWCRRARPTARSWCTPHRRPVWHEQRATTSSTPSSSASRTRPACSPVSPGCSPDEASTSTRWRWRPWSTRASAASPSWSTSSRLRSNRSSSSSTS